MEVDPLQQLRDVHLPPDPAWWPPAPGWWLLAALIITAIFWLSMRARRNYRRRAPLRAARSLLQELYEQYQAGTISALEYMHQGNELLKRLLVRAYGRSDYAPLSGSAWLQALDELSGSNQFTNGPGMVLGDARFSTAPEVDVERLNQAIKQLLGRARP